MTDVSKMASSLVLAAFFCFSGGYSSLASSDIEKEAALKTQRMANILKIDTVSKIFDQNNDITASCLQKDDLCWERDGVKKKSLGTCCAGLKCTDVGSYGGQCQ